ncbi:DUF192 domain-containing protein [uncultured Tessaracoccus sp.]|uniref:DUF192 domain-containing protein n=1 Tax=uncultured Tessaracoccus sp. TaxID=905023 RepID=UPI002602AE7F|nr:DUF192 domain-containing protein [uncultured Tessaracoccus sp.]
MKARAIAKVALLGLLAGCAPSTPAASTATVTVGTRQFQVEVADTAAEQRAGLSGRAEVPEGAGMLFTFAGRVSLARDPITHYPEGMWRCSRSCTRPARTSNDRLRAKKVER